MKMTSLVLVFLEDFGKIYLIILTYMLKTIKDYLWLFSIAQSKQFLPRLSFLVISAFRDNSNLIIST